MGQTAARHLLKTAAWKANLHSHCFSPKSAKTQPTFIWPHIWTLKPVYHSKNITTDWNLIRHQRYEKKTCNWRHHNQSIKQSKLWVNPRILEAERMKCLHEQWFKQFPKKKCALCMCVWMCSIKVFEWSICSLFKGMVGGRQHLIMVTINKCLWQEENSCLLHEFYHLVHET